MIFAVVVDLGERGDACCLDKNAGELSCDVLSVVRNLVAKRIEL